MFTIDLLSKCTWVVPLKGNRGIIIVNAFQKIISKGRKPNKIWIDQGHEFYNKLFKRCLKINNIEMYSAYNERKYVVAKRFIRTWKNKIFKYMWTECNNRVHRTIKMKPTDVENSNEKDPRYKVGDRIKISTYRNVFAKKMHSKLFRRSFYH